MTKIFTKTLTLFLLFFVFVSSQRSFSQCFQIESILVAACSPPGPTTEGYNEMVRFRVGPNPINTGTLTVNWPSNTWQGLVQNATTVAKVAALNLAIDAAGGCGNLIEPVGGVLPANAPVILVTSYLMDTNSNSFGALAEDTYIIFQNNPSTTGGHFGNYNANPGTRTLTMTFGGGCSDTVTYQRADLTGAIGDTVLFTASGTPTYVNYGCSAPVSPFTVDAGTAPANPCPGTTIALLGTADGEQSVAWTAPSGTFSAAANLSTNYTIPASATGQIIITLTATNSCGATITDTVTITVASGTTPTFTLPTTLCSGAAAPVLPTTSNNGVTGTWSPSTVSNTADGSYVFTPNAGQCSAPFTLGVTVQSTSTPVTSFTYPATICSTSTSVFPTPAAGFTNGGAYSVNIAGLTINTTTGEINASTSTPNTYIVTYTITSSGCNGGGSTPFTVQITSAITPVVGFSYPANICKSSTSVMPILDPGFTPGGTFTSDSGLTINPATGEVNPSTSTAAPHSVIYTIVAGACLSPGSDNALITFTAEVTPVVNFTYPAQVCTTSAPVSPTTPTGFTPGGTFTSDAGLTINPTTGAVNIASSTVGPHTITYTVLADPSICQGGDSFSAPLEITANITPVTGFSYPSPICANSAPISPIPAAGFTAGGTYTTNDPGLIINPNTGAINVAASTPASYIVTYTVTADPSICRAFGDDTFPVVIQSLTTPVVNFTYPAQVCSTSAPVTPTTAPGFTPGGVYSSDPGLTINPATGAVNIASSTVGLHTITYTVLADPSICRGGDSFSAPLEIISGITPVTNFSYASPVCTSSAPIFPTPVAGFTTGGAYSANDPGLIINPNTGEINVAASTPASYIVTYTVTADPTICRAFGDDTFPVVIQSLSAPVVNFTYATPVCPNDPPINPTLAPGFTPGGVFTSDAGLSINPTSGQINIAASTPGPHAITYTVLQNNATCTAGDSNAVNFTIDTASALTPITGGTALCVGETLQLANATPGGTWSSSDTSIATVDSNGLVTGVVPNFVDIIYTLNSGCASETRITLAIYAIPQPLLEDRYLCMNNVSGVPFNSVRLHCGLPNDNFTFVWTLNGNPLPTTTNTHVATELGTYEVTVTNTISGCSNTESCEVLKSSTAIATATVGEDFNLNQTITVNATGGSGDYLYQLDYGIPQESNVFTYAHQGEYTITVIDKNGCQDLVLTVFALNYPRFFTPNGDGFNDTWGIKGLTDLKAKTYIFDRFGKLVKFLNASGEEWDGTLNGQLLPSTDYWFLLEYKNRDGIDKEFKAHFSMKR